MAPKAKTETPLETVIYDNDVVIVLSESGRKGAAFIRGHKVPLSSVDIRFGELDDPANTLRQVAVTVGYDLKGWRKSDRDARDMIASGSDAWQAAQDAEVSP